MFTGPRGRSLRRVSLTLSSTKRHAANHQSMGSTTCGGRTYSPETAPAWLRTERRLRKLWKPPQRTRTGSSAVDAETWRQSLKHANHKEGKHNRCACRRFSHQDDKTVRLYNPCSNPETTGWLQTSHNPTCSSSSCPAAQASFQPPALQTRTDKFYMAQFSH
jgi:hypothetical protein